MPSRTASTTNQPSLTSRPSAVPMPLSGSSSGQHWEIDLPRLSKRQTRPRARQKKKDDRAFRLFLLRSQLKQTKAALVQAQEWSLEAALEGYPTWEVANRYHAEQFKRKVQLLEKEIGDIRLSLQLSANASSARRGK